MNEKLRSSKVESLVNHPAIADLTEVERNHLRAKEWAEELHTLRNRLASWSSSYRLIARELDPERRLDIDTPLTTARANQLTHEIITALQELRALKGRK